MEFLKCARDNELLVVRMTRGKANALNAGMIDELSAAVDRGIADDGVRGFLLASESRGCFSAGFDVTEVFGYDRERMRDFFGRFIDLYQKLSRSPKPVVAAINGHAFAGGAVLALSCDLRIMAEGEFGFALNEVNLGVVLPPGIIQMAINAVGVRNARELLLSGNALSPAAALEIGLADELTKPEELLARAVQRLRDLAQRPPSAFGGIKHIFKELTGEESTRSDHDNLDEFIEHWFSAEAMRQKQSLIESLRRKG